MKLLNKITLLVVLLPALAFAQKKQLTLDEAVMQQRTTLAPKRLAQLQWVKGSNDYSYVDKNVLMRGNVDVKAATQVFTLDELNSMLKAAHGDTVPKLSGLEWKSNSTLALTLVGKTYQIDTKLKTAIVVDSSTIPADAAITESGSNATAYVLNDNIYVDVKHKAVQVTSDGSRELVYGKSVHREEFGIDKGLFWAPNGNLLAFYRMDQSMVTDYPIVDFSEKPAKDREIKYPFAGGKSHEVTVGVFDITNGKTVYLKTGMPKDHYLTNIAWSPDAKSIYIAELNRDQNEMNLNQYNAATGDFVKTLFTEKDDKYTEPLHPMEFVPNNPSQFVWQSRRDGWNHLYLYKIDGTLVRQLTQGAWEVIDVAGFDKKSANIYFTSTINSGINRDFCVTSIATGKVKRLTSGDGVHTCLYNQDANYFIDNYSSLNVPNVMKLISLDGKEKQTVLTAENPLKEYAIGTTKMFTIKSKLGEELFCRMVLPVDFDSTKKYPVIVYVYGGPHVQLVTNTWLGGGDLWYQYMSEKGYIVFTLDNHGSGNRGKVFEQATFRQLGTVEMQDQLSGVDYLKSQRYVDETRIGVHGWSFGGFMTTSLMTRNPGVFKAAVAGGPVIDWSYYEVMYTERYMDSPDQNPAGYKAANLLNYVDQLKGKLMLIHGTSDDVVVWQHSLMYLKRAVTKNVMLDYFVYPGHLHNVRGKDRVHLMGKISQYFLENL